VVTDVAAALGCPAGDVWASYVPAAAQHVGPRPAPFPVVTVRGRPRDDDGLGVPVEDVWLQWLDVLPGRAYAGARPL
jgi:hypothetical protein